MVEPRPTKIPRWNDTGGNRTEPPETTPAPSKDTGWAVNGAPPSSYFNWLQHYTGAWFKWLAERFLKGSGEHDLTINALSPDVTGDGGDLLMYGGLPNTTGDGGDATVGGAGSGSGDGGDGTLSGGSVFAPGPGTGGDVNVRAGNGWAGDGGDANIDGGNANGTDQNAGYVNIETGSSTGTGDGRVTIKAATRAAGSGSFPNAPEDYVVCRGDLRQVRHQVYSYMTDPETTRGVGRVFNKAQPTAPVKGDFYLDSVTDQLAMHNGTRYHNLNPLVYNMSDFAITGESPVVGSSTPVVLNEVPYGGVIGTTALRHTLPANSLRVGSLIRIRAIFQLFDLGGGSTYPSPRIYLGNIGGGPSPYTSPTGLQAFAPDRSALIWDSCFVECEISVRGLGSTAPVDARWNATFLETGTPARPVQMQSIVNTYTINTTLARDIFAVMLKGTAPLWQMDLKQFVVDVI